MSFNREGSTIFIILQNSRSFWYQSNSFPPRYNRHIVESGVKHHNPNPF